MNKNEEIKSKNKKSTAKKDIQRAVKKREHKFLHFRGMESWIYDDTINVTTDFIRFVDSEIWPHLISLQQGYKHQQKKEIATRCIHHLITTGLQGQVVADYRDTGRRNILLRKSVWDAIIKAGFAHMCKGSQSSGKTTRYRATNKLLSLRELWEYKFLEVVDFIREPKINENEFSLVLFHEGRFSMIDGEPLPEEDRKKMIPLLKIFQDIRDGNDVITKNIEKSFGRKSERSNLQNSKIVQDAIDRIRAVEFILNEINEQNYKHSWIAYKKGNRHAFQPNPGIKQIHTNSTNLWQEVGLYSWGALSGQNLTRSIRQTMLIDGEKVGEIDSKSHFIRLLYHREGIGAKGDLYSVEKVFPSFANSGGRKLLRDLIKKITVILLFVENRKEAIGAITNYMREELNQSQRNFIKDAIRTEKTDLAGVLYRCIFSHSSKIQLQFYRKMGFDLMRINTQIMLSALYNLVVRKNKPCLPIHDALVVKEKDMEVVEKCYCDSYRRFLKFDPVLERKF